MGRPKDATAGTFMKNLWQDLRYAVRILARAPGLTALAVVSLALGIGANGAIFSVVQAVLLNPVSVAQPDRLLFVWEQNFREGYRFPASPPDFIDWRSQNSTFEQMAAMLSGQINLTGTEQPERVAAEWVSANFFQVIGVRPSAGRTFLPGEERASGTRVAVLSYGLWQRRFGGDPNLIGKTIAVDGENTAVVGIMPRGFHFLNAELWRPLVFEPGWVKSRGSHFLLAIARLRPGVSLERARGDMDVIASRLASQYPDTNTGQGIQLTPVPEQLVQDVRPALLILLGSVALVLLIACANVANLLLTRASGRRREVAIRTALGAGRWRMIRQLLTESVLLALLAAVAGLVVATWAVDALVKLIPSNYVPNQQNIGINVPVLAFTLVLSILTGVVFGLAPVVTSLKLDLTESLKEGVRGATAGLARRRLQHTLVVSEIALSLILLIGSGLLAKSFLRLAKSDPGFQAENILTMELLLPPARYAKPQQQRTLYRGILERARNLPGVVAGGLISSLPLEGQSEYDSFSIEGRPDPAVLQDFPIANKRNATPDYFRVMRIPLRKGHLFTDTDTQSSPPVVVIDEATAKQYWPHEDPIGKRIAYFNIEGKRGGWVTIVGIVGSVKQGGMAESTSRSVYLPFWQEAGGEITIAVRSSRPSEKLTSAVTGEIRAVDPDLPVSKIRTMEDVVSGSVWRPRFAAQLLGIFALLALILAVVGTYGVMAYAVTQRTQEIGVRMALGAKQADMLRLVLVQAAKLTLAGVSVGLAGAFALTRVLSGLLYEVRASDPFIFTVASVALALVALIASCVPARRAARIDPLLALRYE